MGCPECLKEERTSIVYPGDTFVTAAYYPPHHDRGGAYHHHDNNRRSTNYSCSNDHHWSETRYGSCWCGWAGKPEDA